MNIRQIHIQNLRLRATGLTVGSTRTPTLAMASPFSWPVLVPSAFGSGAG